VTRRRLTEHWSIDLDDSFASRVVEGELQLVSPGPPVRTIWLGVWDTSDESLPDTIRRIRESQHADPLERFEEAGADADEKRIASWYPEEDHHGLYAYTVRPGSCVQASFLVDDPADKDWALSAWRSLRYES
jgi:hypothetical protein